MKKLYLFLSAVLLTASSFAQIGPDWWQMLPADWRTNVFVRDTIMITKVADDFVAGYDVLADLWSDAAPDSVLINNKVAGPDADGSADLVASAKFFWDANNLYILYKVADQEVDTAKDLLEIHTAPYGCFYEPGRVINPGGYPPWSNTTPDPLDYEFGGRIIPGLEYVAMAKMGSWTEAGAYKMEIKLKTVEETYPSAVTYTLVGPDKDTLGNVSSGAPDSPLTTVYEATADGYYELIMEPWAVMKDKVPEEGVFESMSIAVKVDDYDSDNADGDDVDTAPDRADYFGGANTNDAYWAIAYYGAVGKFFDKNIEACTLPSGISSFVESVAITTEGSTDITAADQTLDLNATILPEDADVQFVQWKVEPDSAVIDADGVISGFKAGTYVIKAIATAIDGSGAADTLEVSVDIALESGIITKTAHKFAAYPSPAVDMLTISNTQDVTRVDVINIVGQPVASFTNNGSTQMKLNVSRLTQGIYLLNLKTRDGNTTIRFSKQ